MERIPKDNQILEENHKGLIMLFSNLKRLQLQWDYIAGKKPLVNTS